jgi:hypothetical protein
MILDLAAQQRLRSPLPTLLTEKKAGPGRRNVPIVSPVVMHPIPGLLIFPATIPIAGHGGRGWKVRAGVSSSGASAVPGPKRRAADSGTAPRDSARAIAG